MTEPTAIEKKRDIYALIDACNTKSAKKADVDALKTLLNEQPDLARLGELARVNISAVLAGDRWVPAARIMTEQDIKNKRAALGYKSSPELERMLIDTILLAWLRWQEFEYTFSLMTAGGDMTLTQAAFWEKRLTQAQGRYLRACETLARVRKLTSPTMQVNVAQEGSQQVNVAGDLVKS